MWLEKIIAPLKKLDQMIEKVEGWALITFLSVMIIVAFSQVVLRNFFSTALSWGDGLTRALVLWSGFVGASLAVRQGRFISMDAFTRILSKKQKRFTRYVVYLFSTVVCYFLGVAAVGFVKMEYEAHTHYSIGIASWIIEIIIPVTFFFVGFRFLLKVLLLMSGAPLEKAEWERS